MAGPSNGTAHKAAHKAAQPQRPTFDPWNSSSTGHQRAENRLSGSTAWRDSRTRKLAVQFADSTWSGGARVPDTVGVGSPSFGTDGRTANGSWVRGAPGLRARGQLSLLECRTRVEKRKKKTTTTTKSGEKAVLAPNADTSTKDENYDLAKDDTSPQRPLPSANPNDVVNGTKADDIEADDAPPSAQPQTLPSARRPLPPTKTQELTAAAQSAPRRPIFHGVTVYVNGSTGPRISDHALRRLLTAHGAALALTHQRRTVTHVVLGDTAGGGGGGGLAASKMAREVSARGTKVRFVSAMWVVESVKAGRRLDEGRFAVVRAAQGAQRCVRDAFV